MSKIKSKKDIELMREGGKKLSAILDEVKMHVKPGVTTLDLENLACTLIEKEGGKPSFKGYKTSPRAEAFPTALCTSINNEVVHAPASPARKLNKGDIIGIDIGMIYPTKKGVRGMYTDMAVTVGVGEISSEAKKLLSVTKQSLVESIKKVKAGNTINDVGGAVEKYVEDRGFEVVKELVGHGVGHAVHEPPQIPHYRAGKYYDTKLEEGMTIAVEPMVNVGGWEIKVADDNTTIVTADGSLSAHFEHTLLVTKNGCEILTK